MTDDQLLKLLFQPLSNRPSTGAMPAERALSSSLTKLVERTGNAAINLNRQDATNFATASIEIWHRAIHSLLISIALKNDSPIWAAVVGYYASHYTFRAAAHLLGLFSLHGAKCTIEINGQTGPYFGAVVKKRKREHDWYRDKVSSSSLFGGDAFFRASPKAGLDDREHRSIANYGDHLSRYPSISAIALEDVKDRMRNLERDPAVVPPELSATRFPDLDGVWVLAYQRISRFRKLVDDKVGRNRFWEGHRAPSWATQFTNFDLADVTGMSTTN
jgi:hypothetical protein